MLFVRKIKMLCYSIEFYFEWVDMV